MCRFKYAMIFIAFLALFLLFCENYKRTNVQDKKYQDAYEVWIDSENAKEVPYIEVNGIKYFRFDSLCYNYIDKKTAEPLYEVFQKFSEDLYETNKKIYGYQNDTERLFLYYDMEDVNISPVCLYYRSDLDNLEVSETNIVEVKIIELGNSDCNYSIVTKETIKLFLSVINSNVSYPKQEQLFKHILEDENILRTSDYQNGFKIVAVFKDYPYLEFTLGFIQPE